MLRHGIQEKKSGSRLWPGRTREASFLVCHSELVEESFPQGFYLRKDPSQAQDDEKRKGLLALSRDDDLGMTENRMTKPFLFATIIPMTIDEFKQADLRVGKIISAERVEGSEKLLKFQVDCGMDSDGAAQMRQILSGIAKTYAPEDVIGREVVIIANLEPRMMMGMESQGMILAAHGENGEPVLLVPDKEVNPGSQIT